MEENELDDRISISNEEDSTCLDRRSHARPVQYIWDPDTVLRDLSALPGAEEITTLLNSSRVDSLLQHKHGRTTGLLVAAWRGFEPAVTALLKTGSDTQTKDDCGRTPLHLASLSGSPRCVSVLLEFGADVGVWDTAHVATPLHCAASSGCSLCVRLLIRAGADVNAGISCRSALYYAVQRNAVECVYELLVAGACPTSLQVFTETPLHLAASLGATECVRLLLYHGADVRVQCGSEKTTALHLAAQDGHTECAVLLLDAGARSDAINNRRQTPLHLAALAQSAETVELLLRRGANTAATDIDGRTPLHGAVVHTYNDCAKLLLEAGASANAADTYGYTPLHIAALNELSECVLLLLSHGGDVTARTNGGVSVLSFIIRRTPDVLPRFLSHFDASIKLNDHEIGDVDCELKLDFRILVPCIGRGETELLLTFIEVGERDVLKHPLCETFLFLKWKRIRKFFLFSLFYHTVFVLLFTSYVIGVFLRDCTKTSSNVDVNCDVSTPIVVIKYILYALTILIFAKEIFQMTHDIYGYIRRWENWMQWLIIISVPMCAAPGTQPDIRVDVATWQHHVAAIGIFITWLELMLIVGRFPMFGLYVQMFQSVALNFSKFLVAYSCLLIAFGLSFGVLFANYPSYQNLLAGLLKTIIMMSGELEFEDMFYGQETKIQYPVTTHLVFFAFVLLVTVILTNLMVGLAVSDIQGLQQSAGLDRLVRQAELVAHLESMLFSRLLWCVPRKIMAVFHRSALLLSSPYHWTLHIRPNDPRENRIPKELIKNIYELVAQRKNRTRIDARHPWISERHRTDVPGFTAHAIRNHVVQLTADVQHCLHTLQHSTDQLLEHLERTSSKKNHTDT